MKAEEESHRQIEAQWLEWDKRITSHEALKTEYWLQHDIEELTGCTRRNIFFRSGKLNGLVLDAHLTFGHMTVQNYAMQVFEEYQLMRRIER